MPEFTLAQLAEMVGGKVEGDSGLRIGNISDLAGAGPGHLSFLGNRRYLQAAKQTGASAILVPLDEDESFPCALIRVESPSLAFAKVAEHFRPAPVSYAPGVHPTAVLAADVVLGEGASIQPHAVVEAGARIGARTVIGSGVHVGAGAVIGEDCLLYPRVVLREHCVLGSRVILHAGAVIGSDGFGYEFKEGRHEKIPQIGYVQIDDDVEIGSNTTVDRGRFGRTWIKKGAKIDNLVMIAHNVVVGEHSVLVGQVGVSGSTVIGKYVTLAGQVGLAGHLQVGDKAVITAQSGVAKDVPAGSVLSGRHALPLRENLKLEALFRKLPEMWDKIRGLEKAAGK
ncbi:MAG: UDP-3-O-(3-hydroxymyristoyl)glucosamine N-acyltransferase [Verrucomicrobium sp.]|nr:UDP-3-O-(3-hydroxymyristoyl)glucosamine N-acyltransferase [Verrucomicrobium sp.]